MDILTCIAPRLILQDLPFVYDTFKKHHATLLVSKAWRERLMEAGHLRYKNCMYGWNSRHLSNIRQLTPFVKSLALDLYGVSLDALVLGSTIWFIEDIISHS